MLKKEIYTLIAICLLISSVSAQVTIFSEDFQSGIPATWGLRDFDNHTPAAAVAEYTAPWISKIDPLDLTNSNLTASSTSFFSPVGTANRWLISPAITLGSFGNYVSWRALSHDPSYPDNYLVLVSKTDTLIGSFTDTLGYVIGEYANWVDRTADLSAISLDNETIYLAFILQTNDGFKLYVDDVIVTKEDPAGLSENVVDLLKIKTISQLGLYEIGGDFALKEVSVYNTNGQLVLNSSNTMVDIRNQNAGVYFLSVITDKGSFQHKLLKF
ncbi:MAG: choice-of-anchor J domain-containing protein [Crocinitomicaceae bacterium]